VPRCACGRAAGWGTGAGRSNASRAAFDLGKPPVLRIAACRSTGTCRRHVSRTGNRSFTQPNCQAGGFGARCLVNDEEETQRAGLYNVPYRPRHVHDGSESTLELQIESPLLASNEMAKIRRLAACWNGSRTLRGYVGRLPRVRWAPNVWDTWGGRSQRTKKARWSRGFLRSIAGLRSRTQLPQTASGASRAHRVSPRMVRVVSPRWRKHSAQFTERDVPRQQYRLCGRLMRAAPDASRRWHPARFDSAHGLR